MGLPPAEVVHLFQSDDFSTDVRTDEEMAGALGIRGVPFFVFNKKVALNGAQPVEVFIDALKQSSDMEKLK